MSKRVEPDGDLQAALSEGGSFTLAAGTYTGNFELTTDVVVHAEDGTVLTASGRGTVLLCQTDGLTVEIEGLTLREGHAELGAGLCVVANSDVTLRRCSILDNRRVQLKAAGVGVAAGSVTLEHCTFGPDDDVRAIEGAQVVLVDCTVKGLLAVTDGATVRIQGGSVHTLSLRGNPRHTPTVTVHAAAIAETENHERFPGDILAD